MKKTFSVLLTICMVASMVFSATYVSAETLLAGNDGIFWIEETDYDSYNADGFGQLSKKTLSGITLDDLSGGDASYAWWSGTHYSATYKLSATTAGTYKIWFRGSDPANAYYDKAELRVNGTVISLSKVDNTAFQATVDGKNFSCAWFIGEASLSAGVNEITYITNGKSTTGSKYACLFDCVVVAPSTYEWEKPTIATKPKKASVGFDNDGVAWIEESDYAAYSNASDGVLSTRVGKNGTPQSLADSMSGKDAYWAWWSGVTYSATYKVNATEAGKYKLWYRGSDPAGSYHNKSKITVNGTEITVAKVEGTNFTATIDPSGTKKNFACAWFVAEVTLVEGINTIEYNVAEKATSGSKYACLFDCMVVAPLTYEWEKPTVDTKPICVNSTVREFDNNGVAWIEECDYDTYSNAAEGVLSARVGTNGTPQSLADSMSGKDAYWAWWGGVTYSATYKLNAPKTGTYKLWYRGSDPSNEYSDTIKMEVNDTPVTVTKVEGTNFTATIDPSGTKKNYACAWFVAEVSLAEGVNTIEYYVNEKSTKGKYACLFDCMVLAPSTYEWKKPTIDTVPTQIQTVKCGWIEGEDYQQLSDSSVFMARAFDVSDMSGEKALVLSASSAPSGDSGSYYADYLLRVAQSGTYDIFVRSNHTLGGTNNSPINLSVDGQPRTHTELAFEGWINPISGSDKFTVGWSKITMPLDAGTHTLRWEIKQTGGTRYFGIIDSVVFMPASMKFNPKSLDVAGTKSEYELSALLCDYDLSNVSENLILPTQTESGKTVIWSTSDSSVITDKGVVVRSEYYNRSAILTASIAGNHKDFAIVVPRMDDAYCVDNFGFSGTVGNGNTLVVSADVTSKKNDGNIVIIIAQYDSENMLKNYDFNTYSLDENAVISASAEITLYDYSDSDYIRAYIWDDLDGLNTITDSIELK